MPPKSKSIYRQPGAQHFQVVHRSQRDPLVNDPEASQHVLKAVVRGNERRGKTREELETLIDTTKTRENVGEASLYGVYYDDTDYDYMQHLKVAGLQEDGVESIWLDAPSSSRSKGKGAARGGGLTLKDELPSEALPSSKELSMDAVIAAHQAIPSSISGLQPEMDPHLRQTLEALEDEAFIDDEIQEGSDAEDFFGELLGEGERDEEEDFEYEFEEWGVDEEEEVEEVELDPQDWEARFAAFKKQQKANRDAAGSDEGLSEIADTVGTLPKLAVAGGRRRRTGTTDGSGYSLSSSAVYRNEGLTTLDKRFDRMMAKEYGKSYDPEIDEEDEGHGMPPDSESDDEAPPLLRPSDLEHLVDDFLDDFQITETGKLKRTIPGATPMDKLENMRKSLDPGKAAILAAVERQASQKEQPMPMPLDIDEKEDRWDCESILSTYSNLENHPKMIRARALTQKSSGPKFVVDKKTGLPILEEASRPSRLSKPLKDEDDTEDSDDTTKPRRRAAVGRPVDETKEEKKARKQEIKAEKQQRRQEKKTKKQMFAAEFQHQIKMRANEPLPVKKL